MLTKTLKDDAPAGLPAFIKRDIPRLVAVLSAFGNKFSILREALEGSYLRSFWDRKLENEFRTRGTALEAAAVALQAGSDDLDVQIELTASRLLMGFVMAPDLISDALEPRRKFEARVAEVLEPLLNAAIQGKAEADRRLRFFACGFVARSRPMPALLRDYVCKILIGQGPKLKQGRHRTSERDRVIIQTIQEEIDAGFSADRACFFVSEAMGRLKRHMTKEAVTKIWCRSRMHMRRDGQKPL
jgi:hypothetical protein